MIDRAVIDSVPLLAPLSDGAKGALATHGTTRHVPAGHMLWNAGDHPTGLHVIVTGEVRVVRNLGGRQHVVHTETAGGTLGDVPLFDGSPYPATATAVTSCLCLVFSTRALQAAIEEDAHLAFALLGRLAARVRHVIGRLDAASTHTVPQRLAAYLLTRVEAANSPTITLGRTQSDIAEELGTVREVLVRAMRTLRDEGVIAPAARGQIRVLSRARLRRRALEL